MPKVVTRFAPSPTGNLNVGGIRAGIFAYLFARHNGGKFIVRIEDTDKERSKKEFEDNIFESLAWLGIDIDATYRQSKHAARYEELLRKLIAEDKIYVAKEEPKEPDGRSEVIRFRNPNKIISFFDAVHGQIEFDTTELKDFIIAKSFTEPLFHFAVVVDDWDEGVTHVVRGEDHISNTPRQILIQEALGVPRPKYAHLPLIVSSDRSKLSKRKGAVAITEYKKLGYVPEAILNYDSFLGWHPAGEKEIYSKEELITEFTLDRVQKSPAMFDETKLLWFNHEHLKKLSDSEYAARLKEFAQKDVDPRLVPLLKEHAKTLKEAAKALEDEFDFLGGIAYKPEFLLQGGKITAEVASNHLKTLSEILQNIPDEGFTPAQLKDILWPYATDQGRGEVLWPLRVALSGREKSPDPFTLCSILGKAETLERIAQALQKL
ncbi:glutamate--tRNA ligase [Candidatus Adlerbacteria bacterium RIFCSPHIGHO2_02_FULL_54_18]|uniref:Glutamate--tRNA ligase n=1 Tax=Candidatus Adlerbacteria bacterium RIFCSPHIGHO2_02_FULL_54_18 TaxID=1797241 RepID=A0A1F4Y300_9BACT|nr:MAG: glutamate--tRNA ligase [Candidatus Adlerbacteria bacterium RIFCSPHIGHO2_02_FULL_54_18]